MTTLTELLRNPRGLTMAIRGRKLVPAGADPEWPNEHYTQRVTLAYRGHTMRLAFHQGAAHVDPPTRLDVIECVLDDTSGLDNDGATFEEWAEAYGYDTDSRSAERTYRAVVKQAKQVRELFGADFDTWMDADR